MSTRALATTGLGIVLIVLAIASPAGAQYFGRNKVQYERFEFTILQTPHFDIYYYQDEQEAAALAARMAERWYARLSAIFGHEFERRQPIIFYASHSHFAQTSVVDGGVPEGVGGFTDHLVGRVVLPFAAGLGETNHVLGHELVHAFQRDILRQRGRSLALLPLWFSEGMAEYFSLDGLDTNTKMWLRDAATAKRLPTIAQLEDPRYFPYRFGQALWAYVAGEYGQRSVVAALKSRASSGVPGRLRDATGVDTKTLSKGWHEAIHKMAAEIPAVEDAPGRTIVDADDGGRMNVSPSISPDGKSIVFLSERDGYSVDVFLADTERGKVRRKLLSTAADPHFDSLQFLESAGAWDSNGGRFAIATVEDGRPVLNLFAMPSGDLAQQIPLPELDQAFNPVWSPGGREIAFSGLQGGISNLFTASVDTGAVRHLTNDLYSDLHPSYSPDGRRIAFASDRFSSDPAQLMFGMYELAQLELSSGRVTRLGPEGLGSAKSIDPQWSGDGVFFVSDASGASNVYRLDPANGRIDRITNVPTGVTGLTALSPAISVSHDAAAIAMSVYAHGAYEIRILNAPWKEDAAVTTASAEAITRAPAATVASVAPATITQGGIEASDAFVRRPYEPRLSVFAMGQPYLTAGGGAFGNFFRAGTSFSLGDMLGEQELVTALQVGKGMDDFALQTTYLNRRSRWNWAVFGGQIPAFTGFSSVLSPEIGPSGEQTIVRTETTARQIHRRVAGVVSYPINHAQRLEVSAGIEAIAFARSVTRSSFAPITGILIDRERSRVDGTPALLGHAGAALVYDTSLQGPTSPIRGQRYRLAIEPSFGDLSLVSTVIDYRRYLTPWRPFTFALRVGQRARWGGDRSDERLTPLVWTLRDLVRGFAADRDAVAAAQVENANFELRAPVSSLLRRDRRPGPLPVEAFAFANWARISNPAATASARVRQLSSAGLGIRLNASGFLFELDAVHPMHPASGWRFSVNFLPGF